MTYSELYYYFKINNHYKKFSLLKKENSKIYY